MTLIVWMETSPAICIARTLSTGIRCSKVWKSFPLTRICNETFSSVRQRELQPGRDCIVVYRTVFLFCVFFFFISLHISWILNGSSCWTSNDSDSDKHIYSSAIFKYNLEVFVLYLSVSIFTFLLPLHYILTRTTFACFWQHRMRHAQYKPVLKG